MEKKLSQKRLAQLHKVYCTILDDDKYWYDEAQEKARRVCYKIAVMLCVAGVIKA